MTQPVILFTFGGRQPNIELQLPYIRRILNEHPNAEWHLWDLARNPKDSAYLRSIEGERIKVRTEFSVGAPWRGQSRVWKYYAASPRYHDHLFVKLDDDVVFLETAAFGSLTQSVQDNPEHVISALTINNGASTPLIPELQAARESLDIPLLHVHLYPEFAERSHRWFFDNWRTIIGQPGWCVPTTDWLSINCIAYTWETGRDIALMLGTRTPREIAGRKFTPRDKVGDEGAANTKPKLIHTGCVAAHLTFSPQDKAMDSSVLTELRKNYADIGRQYLGS